MSNIALVLKSEIVRIARKETKSQTEALRKTLTATRTDLRSLKQRLDAAEKELARRTPPAPPQSEPPTEQPAARRPRFSPAWMGDQRQRLGLTQSEMAKLVGVSALSIYNWESGRVRPRDSFIRALAALRSLSKDEITEKLGPSSTAST